VKLDFDWTGAAQEAPDWVPKLRLDVKLHADLLAIDADLVDDCITREGYRWHMDCKPRNLSSMSEACQLSPERGSPASLHIERRDLFGGLDA